VSLSALSVLLIVHVTLDSRVAAAGSIRAFAALQLPALLHIVTARFQVPRKTFAKRQQDQYDNSAQLPCFVLS
jgi:hypothetical protein